MAYTLPKIRSTKPNEDTLEKRVGIWKWSAFSTSRLKSYRNADPRTSIVRVQHTRYMLEAWFRSHHNYMYLIFPIDALNGEIIGQLAIFHPHPFLLQMCIISIRRFFNTKKKTLLFCVFQTPLNNRLYQDRCNYGPLVAVGCWQGIGCIRH